MISPARPFLALTATALLALGQIVTAAPHSYQVTGPILELSDSSITVQKGAEKWEIARDASTKVTGELKVGSKVTIEYFMTATTATVKADKAAAPAKGEKPAAPAKAEKAAPKAN